MKVLYISYDGVTDPLGQSQIIPYLKQLSDGGDIEFVLLTFDKTMRLRDRLLVGRTRRLLQDSGIKWRVLKYHKKPSSLATAYDIILGVLAGLWLIKRNGISIIHARSYVASLIAVFLKKFTGCKFIFDMRGFWPEERVDAGLWKKDSRLYKTAKFFEKKFILNSDWIIVLSYKAKQILERQYLKGLQKAIEVIPTCVDTRLFLIKETNNNYPLKNIRKSDKFILTYLGSIGTWYCLEEMIEFFKVAKGKLNNAFFLFLTPSDKRDIENFILSKGLSEHDFMIKDIYYQEVPKWLSLSDATIFFIKPLFSKKASCPTKFAESLACGIPVIANSGIGDCDEIINKNKIGVIVDNFSENCYSKAILEITKLLQSRAHIRTICRETAENIFSLDRGINKYLNIYQKLQ